MAENPVIIEKEIDKFIFDVTSGHFEGEQYGALYAVQVLRPEIERLRRDNYYLNRELKPLRFALEEMEKANIAARKLIESLRAENESLKAIQDNAAL